MRSFPVEGWVSSCMVSELAFADSGFGLVVPVSWVVVGVFDFGLIIRGLFGFV
jgi:hypothetical protein